MLCGTLSASRRTYMRFALVESETSKRCSGRYIYIYTHAHPPSQSSRAGHHDKWIDREKKETLFSGNRKKTLFASRLFVAYSIAAVQYGVRNKRKGKEKEKKEKKYLIAAWMLSGVAWTLRLWQLLLRMRMRLRRRLRARTWT